MDKEELIFNMYKDSVVIGKKFRKEISRTYKLKNTEISNICAKISKYQIERYGSSLEIDIGYKSKEETERLSINNRQRRNKRRKGWEE